MAKRNRYESVRLYYAPLAPLTSPFWPNINYSMGMTSGDYIAEKYNPDKNLENIMRLTRLGK